MKNWIMTFVLIALAGVLGTAFFAPDKLKPIGYTGDEALGWFRAGDFVRQAAGVRSASDSAARIIAFRGDTIVIDYTVEQENGYAYLHLWKTALALLPGELMWHDSIGRDGRHRIEVQVAESGVYRLDAGLSDFAGSLDVSWHVN